MFKENPSILIFFQSKSACTTNLCKMLNSYLIKGERPSLSSHLFYGPPLRYIANQSGSAKETVSPKVGKNIEMLVCFICMGTQDRTLIDINHYQIMINQHKSFYLISF